MDEPKSATEAAARQKREAHMERRYKWPPALLRIQEEKVEQLLQLPTPPDVGAGGEVARANPLPEGANVARPGNGRLVIQDTLAEGATRIAEDASIRRTDLLLAPSFNAVALGLDTAQSVNAANSVEKMICHQMAVAHEASLRLLDRALSYEAGGRSMREGDSVEACRLSNSAARLLSAFNDAALTLQKLRTGGSQTVTVQHVTVAPGGQAVIGNVRAGGHDAGGRNEENG